MTKNMIELNCISIIVPIHKLDAVYEGGFRQYRLDFEDRIARAEKLGGIDDDLVCFSVMNPLDEQCIINELKGYGLQKTERWGYEEVYKDFCIHGDRNELEYPCKWLVRYAYYAAYLPEGGSYYKLESELCQTFRQNYVRYVKEGYQEQFKGIREVLKSPLEMDSELNERNLFYTDKLISQECEVVRSTFVNRDREDALWKTMVPVYEDLAKAGNGEAYNLLGIIFQLDKERADGYFEAGMVNGSAYAALNLAMRTENLKEKFALYLWASEHIMSIDEENDLCRGMLCGNLGKMYQLGIGTAPDKEEAERWYRAAMANQNDSVVNNLAILLYKEGRRLEAIGLLTALIKRHHEVHYPKEERNRDRMAYGNMSEQVIRLSIITDSFMDCIAVLQVEEEKDRDWNSLLLELPDLELDKNYVLDDFRSDEETNSVLLLYARHRSSQSLLKNVFPFCRKSVKPLDVFQFITLPFTEEAIWQAFLLSQTYHLVGMRWHGGYEERTFIVSDKDIADLKPLFGVGKGYFSCLQEQIQQVWTPDLCASVSLFDNYAIVSHCWFDNWKGFSQVKWKIKYDVREKRVVGIEKESEQVLVKYHCGVWF